MVFKEWEVDIGCPVCCPRHVTWVVTNEELLVTYRISVGWALDFNTFLI